MFSDRLGNVLSVADPATGVLSGTAVYDSFGGRTVTGEAIRYGFTGREHDAESGLIHFRARAYDPATGQFLQRDPIGFAAGDLNLYAYVWNNPYNWTDPSGTSAALERQLLAGTGFSAIALILQQTLLAALDLNKALDNIVLQNRSDGDGQLPPPAPSTGDGGNNNCKPDPGPSRWQRIIETSFLLLSLATGDPSTGTWTSSGRHVRNTQEISRRVEEAEARERERRNGQNKPDC